MRCLYLRLYLQPYPACRTNNFGESPTLSGRIKTSTNCGWSPPNTRIVIKVSIRSQYFSNIFGVPDSTPTPRKKAKTDTYGRSDSARQSYWLLFQHFSIGVSFAGGIGGGFQKSVQLESFQSNIYYHLHPHMSFQCCILAYHLLVSSPNPFIYRAQKAKEICKSGLSCSIIWGKARFMYLS